MGQPPPPQYSPDRRFYWDGTRWVPVPVSGWNSFVSSAGSCYAVVFIGLVIFAVLLAVLAHH